MTVLQRVPRRLDLHPSYLCVPAPSNPASMARTAAWVRSDTPSLEIMCCTWILTVPRLTSRFLAIWGFVCPWLSNLNTSTSLGVRLSICSAPSDCLDLLDLEWVA